MSRIMEDETERDLYAARTRHSEDRKRANLARLQEAREAMRARCCQPEVGQNRSSYRGVGSRGCVRSVFRLVENVQNGIDIMDLVQRL